MRKKEKDEDIVVFSEDDLHTTEDELELSKKIEKEEHTSGNSNEEDKKDIFMEDIEDYSDFEDFKVLSLYDEEKSDFELQNTDMENHDILNFSKIEQDHKETKKPKKKDIQFMEYDDINKYLNLSDDPSMIRDTPIEDVKLTKEESEDLDESLEENIEEKRNENKKLSDLKYHKISQELDLKKEEKEEPKENTKIGKLFGSILSKNEDDDDLDIELDFDETSENEIPPFELKSIEEPEKKKEKKKESKKEIKLDLYLQEKTEEEPIEEDEVFISEYDKNRPKKKTSKLRRTDGSLDLDYDALIPNSKEPPMMIDEEEEKKKEEKFSFLAFLKNLFFGDKKEGNVKPHKEVSEQEINALIDNGKTVPKDFDKFDAFAEDENDTKQEEMPEYRQTFSDTQIDKAINEQNFEPVEEKKTDVLDLKKESKKKKEKKEKKEKEQNEQFEKMKEKFGKNPFQYILILILCLCMLFQGIQIHKLSKISKQLQTIVQTEEKTAQEFGIN